MTKKRSRTRRQKPEVDLQGPPPRPLPRILLQRRGDDLVATGVEEGGPVEVSRAEALACPRARA